MPMSTPRFTLPDLPVCAVLPELLSQLSTHAGVVLEAPPGAGKSTVVPLALLQSELTGNQRILMLEPRRLAARTVAHRMSSTLGEPVGQTVGYRTRLDTAVSARTRIEVITEGILLRLLEADPSLADVAFVVFDEFHERSLQADLGLALCLDARKQLDANFKILVMSATLDGLAVAQLLGGAPIVRAQGRRYPVEVRYAAQAVDRLVPAVTATVRKALTEASGDVLVFLPGTGEIRQTEAALHSSQLPSNIHVLSLYGELASDAQDAVLRPAPAGSRKIILATSIAETSLTIEGVRIVVDSGLARRNLFDPVTGMNALVTVRASLSSAEQRRGRAGRTASGVCYRLWTQSAESSLATYIPAEILEADLAPLALALAVWGTPARQLTWLDAPPAPHLNQAQTLLKELNALDDQYRLTETGRQMASMGMHPRLARLNVAGRALGCERLSAELAALLMERDIVRTRPQERDADLRKRILLLRGDGVAHLEADRAALARARQLVKHSGASGLTERDHVDYAGALLAVAYPDRIAMRRGDTARYLLANGRGASFKDVDALSRCPLLVIAELDGADRDARIFLAAPVSLAALAESVGHRLQWVDQVSWDDREQAVMARRERRLGALVLEDRPWPEAPEEALTQAMLEGMKAMGLNALPWSRDSNALKLRAQFIAALPGEEGLWPDLSDEGLLASLSDWLLPWLSGCTRRSHLSRLNMSHIVEALLGYERKQKLDAWAPTHLTVPSGSRLPIDYEGDSPALSVRLQELFGLKSTPRLAGGRVPLTLRLTSPAGRPVQVTRDLDSFWARGYAEVRKELKGRYPKHYWPEDPLTAEPTARARPRPT